MELSAANFLRYIPELPKAAPASSGDPSTLEPVIVTGEREVSGDFASAYTAFLTSAYAGEPLDDHEQPIGPDDPVLFVDPRLLVENHPQFLKLPEEMREVLLKSEVAITQLARFFSNGGVIVISDEVGEFGGQYFQNVITLSRETLNNIANGVEDRVGAMIFTLLHELGHYIVEVGQLNSFDMSSGETGWVTHRALGEALANANAMLIANDIRNSDSSVVIPFTGYATNSVLVPLWNQFAQDSDFDSLVESMFDLVIQKSWDGPDLNGDGVTNQEDRFIYEWRNR